MSILKLEHLRKGLSRAAILFGFAFLVGCQTTEMGDNLGNFSMPPSAHGPVPAVILIGGTGGSSGRYEFHGPALRAAGFAVFEAQWWAPGQSYDVFQVMGLLFKTLSDLQKNPAIDANRIAVMGFSRGGGLGLRAANIYWTNRYGLETGFAAHVLFYPVCDRPKTESALTANATGAPILILAGELDHYGEGKSCPRLVQRINAKNPGVAKLKIYPSGGHGFDANFGWNGAAALDSRRRAVEFLKQVFGRPFDERRTDLFLTKKAIRRDIIGNTLKFPAPRSGRILSVYFAGDGAVELKPQGIPRTFRKKWFFNDSGWLCRTVGLKNQELCGKIRKLGPSDVEISHPVLGKRYRAKFLSGRQLND